MNSKRKRNSLEVEVQDSSDQLMIQQLHTQQINHLNQQQEGHNQSATTGGHRFHQQSHQYQEMCEEPRSCEEKESSRIIPTSIVEDVKPELVHHGHNNNNEDETDFPIDKRILRSSLIVSSASSESNHPPSSGSSLWLMNVDGQTNGGRSDTNPQSTATSDADVATATSLHNQSLIQQIGGSSFREHDPAPGGTDGLLGTGSQQQPHHLSDNIQQPSHHQNIAVDDEGSAANTIGGRNHNRYLRDYHTLSSAHQHLINPQSLPPPPSNHHPQELHTGFEHLGGGGDQDTFGDRYQTRPVDLGYVRNSGGAGQGQYSPQGGQGVSEPWTAPAAAHQLLAQDYFNAADGRHQSTISQGNPLGWPTPAEHQGHHHHHHHHRFGGAMGHPSHAAVAAVALAQASSMKWGDASTTSSLNMAVGGGVNNSGRPGSAMSGKSKLCSPTSYRLG